MIYYQQRLVLAGRMMILLMIMLALYGCGSAPHGSANLPSDGSNISRGINGDLCSESINNYGTWGIGSTSDSASVLQARLNLLGKRNFVTFGENAEWPNDVSGWSKLTPMSIKAINPNAKVYRYYTLMFKDFNDSDWNKASDTRRMNGLLDHTTVDANDWWLRDGDGNIVPSSRGRYYDVGKPGFKEAYLKAILDRNAGKGFDGVLLDIWCPRISVNWFANGYFTTHPLPAAYKTDADWLNNAWKPFIQYVVDGLHAAGYRVIGNCVGEYDTGDPNYIWQRSVVDGTVYEQWAVNWDGSWLSGSTMERRINDLRSEPLETWITDAGLKSSLSDYDQRHAVALAAFLIGTTGDLTKQSYGNSYDSGNPFWRSLWDVNVGTPSELAVKMSGRYFWSRQFSGGIVLLNYDSESVSFSLPGTYADMAGATYFGSISVPAHTGLILKTAAPASSGSPADWTVPVGTKTVLSTDFAPAYAGGQIMNARVVMNTTLSQDGGVTLMYSPERNKLYLWQSDRGNWGDGVVPGADSVLENGQFRLYCRETVASRSGDHVIVNWMIEPKSVMAGLCCGVWEQSSTKKSPSASWKKVGEMQVS